MEIDVLMSNVEGNEIIEHITFKRGLHIIEHVVRIPSTNLHSCYEIINKNVLSLCKFNQGVYCL